MPKLTDRLLTSLTLSPGQRDRLVFDTACPGLGVRITQKGSRGFVVQWTDRATKRKVREPLGLWGSLTIEQARDAARARLGDVAKGINPKAARAQAKTEADRRRAENALTLGDLVSKWAALHLVHRRARYAAEATRAIRYAFADLMKRPAARVTRADALGPLDRLVMEGKVVTAGRTMSYARSAYSWAQKRGAVAANPFQGLPIAPVGEARERALTDVELAEVWAAAAAMSYPFGPLFQLAILTLQRRDGVAGLRWSEVSADQTTWTIPGPRMKNGSPHVVHLSVPARAVLADIARIEGRDLIFTTTGATPSSGFSAAKRALDARIVAARADAATETGKKAPELVPWRLHDLRRTGVSKLAALGIDSIVADKLLAHKAGKLHGVAAVYQRYDFAEEQAKALDLWAAHVLSTRSPQTSNQTVVSK